MNILFLNEKAPNVYQERLLVDIIAQLEDKHNIEVINENKGLLKTLEGKNPDIINIRIGGKMFKDVTDYFKDSKAIIVSNMQGFANFVDIFINDEAEEVFPLLVKAIEGGKDLSEVPGITYKHTTRKADNWNINNIPSTLRNENFITFSNRGCKGTCSFCNIPKRQGCLRFRDIPSIMKEITNFYLIPGYGRHFQFSDCSFDSNSLKRMKTIARAIGRGYIKVTYETNIRPDFHKIADNELMDLFLYSGHCSAFIGVESANTEDLTLYNKQTTNEDAELTIEMFKRNDAAIEIGFINLNPFSTFDRLRQNVKFLQKHHLATYTHLTKKLDVWDTPIKETIKNAGLLTGLTKYEYQDKNITLLVAILKLIEDDLKQNTLAIYKDLSIREIKRLKCLMRITGNEEDFIKIQKHENNTINLLNDESNRLSEWFINLLDIVEQEKPYEEIFKMSNAYINTKHMQEVIIKFKAIDREMRVIFDKTNLESIAPKSPK